jgi:hypothetical protein
MEEPTETVYTDATEGGGSQRVRDGRIVEAMGYVKGV